MFSQKITSEQPFATNLFTAAITAGKLAHAYLFTKAQAIVQYEFALELAKILNCSVSVDGAPCNNCRDCKWISVNSHPAVITVSPVDYLPRSEDLTDGGKVSKAKNIIKVEQARLLQKTLMTGSKHHRVVIFTGATEENLPDEEFDNLWLDYKTRVCTPESSSQQRDNWVARYLNYQSFPDQTANILLKTIEEPQGKVLYIFITKDSDDMLGTIVSRCQVMPLLRKKELSIEPLEYIQEIATFFPPQNELECIKIAKQLLDFSKKEGLAIEKILDYVTVLYKKQLDNSLSNVKDSYQYINDLKCIEETKRMITNYVNPQAALIQMLNQLIVHH